jgi:hypothetical protein
LAKTCIFGQKSEYCPPAPIIDVHSAPEDHMYL